MVTNNETARNLHQNEIKDGLFSAGTGGAGAAPK